MNVEFFKFYFSSGALLIFFCASAMQPSSISHTLPASPEESPRTLSSQISSSTSSWTSESASPNTVTISWTIAPSSSPVMPYHESITPTRPILSPLKKTSCPRRYHNPHSPVQVNPTAYWEADENKGFYNPKRDGFTSLNQIPQKDRRFQQFAHEYAPLIIDDLGPEVASFYEEGNGTSTFVIERYTIALLLRLYQTSRKGAHKIAILKETIPVNLAEYRFIMAGSLADDYTSTNQRQMHQELIERFEAVKELVQQQAQSTSKPQNSDS